MNPVSPTSRGPEAPSMNASPESKNVMTPEADFKDINKAKVNPEAIAGIDSSESSEDLSEMTDGRISEVMSDTKEDKGGGAATTGGKPVDPVKIRAQLLKNMPTEKEMKKQIEKEIKKEIKYLHKKALKMLSNPGSMSFFEMANLMKKVRDLKSVLFALLKASLDSLKTFWLRFVHGVM